MRRQDKELIDREAIEAVIRRARVCRVAMCDGDVPYVVPMSFGYRDGRVWLHCAAEGRKIDILRVNDRVCFEVDLDHATNRGEESCGWNLRYRSVIGFGRARIVEDEAGKREGLDVETVIDEFGLERLEDYWARVLTMRESMLREGHV